MTNNQLNKAIHAWMGRGEWSPLVDPFDENSGKDYCQSHDDVREFLVKAIGVATELTVRNTIYLENQEHFDDDNEFETDIVRGLLLTPRQLAEAGAKAVWIWRDKKPQTYKLQTIEDILKLPDGAFERCLVELQDALRSARVIANLVSTDGYTMEWTDDDCRDQTMVVGEDK